MTRSLARLRSTVVAGLFVLAGPAQAGTLSVIGVAPGDTLRLRAGPSPDTDEVGRIPPDADGLEPGEPTSNLDWLSVTYRGATGYVNARYLAYGAQDERPRLPVRLACAGTEPFWSIDVGFGRAHADLLYAEKAARLSLSEPEPARGYSNPWLMRMTSPAGDGFLLIGAEQCSDGMSDETYPFSLSAQLGGTFLRGCCAPG